MIYANNKPIEVTLKARAVLRHCDSGRIVGVLPRRSKTLPALAVWAWCGK